MPHPARARVRARARERARTRWFDTLHLENEDQDEYDSVRA